MSTFPSMRGDCKELTYQDVRLTLAFVRATWPGVSWEKRRKIARAFLVTIADLRYAARSL